MDEEEEQQEYNNYVLSDGIHAKVDAKVNAKINAEILGRIYARARQRMRERGGSSGSGRMLTTQEALKLLLREEGGVQQLQQKITEELFNEHMDDLSKEGYPLLAENLRSKDEKTRDDALRVLRMIKEKMESLD
jgi:hypothetical protein